MITLFNKDKVIYDLEYRIVDILEEYQRTGKIKISTNAEGICLNEVKFYDLLDYICEKFNIKKSDIIIYTANALEKHNEYIILTKKINHWFELSRQSFPVDYRSNKNKNLKTLGCFLGKINWNRTIIMSWLYNNYRDKSLLTFNYNHTDAEKINSGITDINFYMEDCLEEAVVFLKHTPLLLDNKYDAYENKNKELQAQYDLIEFYNQIFLDLVSETYIMGNTFFPTEKTFRPIIAKTPFIIMGPNGYLANFRALGFRTFDRWWSEDYDIYEGPNRIVEIKKILNEIFTWPQEKLQQILLEMQDILNYNYNHYMSTNYDKK